METQPESVRDAIARVLHAHGLMTLEEARAYSAKDTDHSGAHVATGQEPHGSVVAYPDGFKLSVLMPAYNEKRWLTQVVERVSRVPIPKEIIVVDDGSTDGTQEVVLDLPARFPGVRVLVHEKNRGKGAAVRTAIAAALGSVCLIQDADLEGEPNEYVDLLQPILSGRADAVYGSRFVGGGARRVNSLTHYVANRMLTDLSNVLTNLRLTDMETCYKVVRTDLLKSLRLQANRFEIEPELTVRLAAAGARIYEVPVSYNPRDYRGGKKIGWKDGVAAIWWLLYFRLTRG